MGLKSISPWAMVHRSAPGSIDSSHWPRVRLTGSHFPARMAVRPRTIFSVGPNGNRNRAHRLETRALRRGANRCGSSLSGTGASPPVCWGEFLAPAPNGLRLVEFISRWALARRLIQRSGKPLLQTRPLASIRYYVHGVCSLLRMHQSLRLWPIGRDSQQGTRHGGIRICSNEYNGR